MRYTMRSAGTRLLFILAVLVVCVAMPSCSLVAPQYPYQGVLLDAVTGLPAAGVDIILDTVQLVDIDNLAPLEGQALQDELERILNGQSDEIHYQPPVVRTDAAGQLAGDVTVFGYPAAQATGISGCTAPLGPPMLVERVWVHAKTNGVWRQLEVPLTEGDQSEIVASDYVAGVRRIVLPTIYVTADGLSLAAGQ